MNKPRTFSKQLYRELLLYHRQPQFLLHAALFFLMIIVFFPLSLPPDPALRQAMFPGLMWTAVLLAMLLSSVNLFQQDYENGVIEQWLISGSPLSTLIGAKMFIHWLLHLLPLLFFCPLLAGLFQLTPYETVVLIISLIVGTPSLFLLCGLAAAFVTGIQQKGILMALVLLPLSVPIMIFGSSALIVAMQEIDVRGYLAFLLAISLLAIGFLPFAIAAVIRISLAE